MSELKVTMLRGLAGKPAGQRNALKGLGLKRRHQTVVVQDTPAIRGMITKVSPLVEVAEVKE